MNRPDEVLAVFARFPRAGRVKSRLAAAVGESTALEVYEAMLFDTLESLASLGCAKKLYVTDCNLSEGHRLLRQVGLKDSYQIVQQEGNDLGDRMRKSTRFLLDKFSKVVIVGSDAPTLPLSYVLQAFDMLNRVSVVLGPVDDGGYCLLGSSAFHESIFRGIPWGTEDVLERTLLKLEGIPHCLLPKWFDIDTVEDLNRLRDDVRTGKGREAPRLRVLFQRRGGPF